MLSGSELALNRAEVERHLNRESAVLVKGQMEGYKFIRLKLNDIRRRKISGIDILFAHEFNNAKMGNIIDYQLEKRGGDIEFRHRPDMGMFIYDMLDTEHNRQFLASHYSGHYWDITDNTIENDIKLREQKMREDMLKKKPDPHIKEASKEFWKEANKATEQARKALRGEDGESEDTEKIESEKPIIPQEPVIKKHAGRPKNKDKKPLDPSPMDKAGVGVLHP